MSRCTFHALLLFALALVFGAPRAVHAETYNTCTGFITSLPAVITTQGTWCFKQDLATAVTSGNAIEILTNNVTIDCNNYKLGGLAAGLGTATIGIHALDRLNATVRHCNIRGFLYGIFFDGSSGGGGAVEDNRFDGNTLVGLEVDGDGSVIQRNRVFDSGGTTLDNDVYGIVTTDSVDILDNTVSGVAARTGSNGYASGIYAISNLTGRIVGNGVHGVLKDGSGLMYGIFNSGSDRLTLRDNDLVGDASTGSIGLFCETANGRAKDNVIGGFATAIQNCGDAGGNDITP